MNSLDHGDSLKVFYVSESFGSSCTGAREVINFLKSTVLPEVRTGARVSLDFSGVRNVNSSFANALVVNLVGQGGRSLSVLDSVRFVNVRQNVKNELSTGLALAQKKYSRESLTT